MISTLLAIVTLILLYGISWHDRPARERAQSSLPQPMKGAKVETRNHTTAREKGGGDQQAFSNQEERE
jgi:hypothetical protein